MDVFELTLNLLCKDQYNQRLIIRLCDSVLRPVVQSDEKLIDLSTEKISLFIFAGFELWMVCWEIVPCVRWPARHLAKQPKHRYKWDIILNQTNSFRRKILEGLWIHITREAIVKQTRTFLRRKTFPLRNHLEHNTSKRMLILAVTEGHRTIENVTRILTHLNF